MIAHDKNNRVVFITNNVNTPTYDNIEKIVYPLRRKVPDNCHRYLRFYEEAIIHGQSAAGDLLALQQQGFKPDIIVGHSWGNSMFVKDIYPDVPYVAYVEWYYNYVNSDVDFVSEVTDVNQKASLICKNSHILQDLVRCDYAITPTNWQKSQVPEIFRDKINVIHEGIDTDYCKPDDKATFKIPDKDIVLTKDDEILTYATRGMEEYRGFPEFMHAASILMKQRPNLKVVVAGEDRVCYGKKIANSTFKTEMLKKYEFDTDRLFFVGSLAYKDYVNLLQVSSAHVYLTYPFVLSWSFLEAMSTGCVIIASDTQPVKEVMQDNVNGLLVNFYDIDAIVNKVNEVLDNRGKYTELTHNARQTVIDNYNLKDMIKKQLEFLDDCVKNYKKS